MRRLDRANSRSTRWLDGFPAEQSDFRAGLLGLAPGPTEATGQTPSPFAKVVGAATRQVEGAARDAVSSGTKAAGTVAGAVVTAAVTSVAGPVFGGIVGALSVN